MTRVVYLHGFASGPTSSKARHFQDRLARVTPGSDKWETLREAIRQGRLHAGEAGISGIRKEIQRLINEEMNLGFAKGVQITVICEEGPFDQGPFIPLREPGN